MTVGNSSLQTRVDLIARGQITGAKLFSSFGRYESSGAVTNQVIWPDGNWSYPASSGVQMSIVSTSAQDGVGGYGSFDF